MGSLRSRLLALFATTALAGCALLPRQVEVWARVVPDEKRPGQTRVEIDEREEFHDSVVVEPGDRIAWVCHCPPGTEFAVEELHFLGDLEQLVAAHRRRPNFDPRRLERLGEHLGSLEATVGAEQKRRLAVQKHEEAAARTPERGATEALSGGSIPLEGPIEGLLQAVGDLHGMISDLRTVFSPAEPPNLFKSWCPPSEFIDGSKRIRSGRVAEGIPHGLWKFTWKVRIKGDEDSEDTMDPHIYGHPEISW